MLKKVITAVGIVLGFLLLSYSVAAAWHATVTLKTSCLEGYNVIEVTVVNSEAQSPMTYTWADSQGPSGTGNTPAGGTQVFYVDHAANGLHSFTVVPSWPGSEEHTKAYARIQVTSECPQPTTTTRPPATTVPPTTQPTTTVPPVTTTTPPVTTVVVPPTTVSTTTPPATAPPEPPTTLAFTGTAPWTLRLAVVGLFLLVCGLTVLTVAGNKETPSR